MNIDRFDKSNPENIDRFDKPNRRNSEGFWGDQWNDTRDRWSRWLRMAHWFIMAVILYLLSRLYAPDLITGNPGDPQLHTALWKASLVMWGGWIGVQMYYEAYKYINGEGETVEGKRALLYCRAILMGCCIMAVSRAG